MAGISAPPQWCHFLQMYHYLHLLIYLAGHKREGLLPTYYLPQSHHHIYSTSVEEPYYSFSHMSK